jgi:hypothetical protein
MATAVPSTTPNPDAMKFTLDVQLPDMINASSADEATTGLARALLDVPGVANVFGVNDFVTITRQPGTPWEPIIEAVQAEVASL